MKTNIIDLGVPVNPAPYESVYGIMMPQVRGIEEVDPVYWRNEDSVFMDLRERTIVLANEVSTAKGGYFHQYFSEFRNDLLEPFTYGSINDLVTTDFPSSTTGGTSKGYLQFSLGSMVRNTAPVDIKLHYCMSTPEAAKIVKLVGTVKLIRNTNSVNTGAYVFSQGVEFPVVATAQTMDYLHTGANTYTFRILASDLLTYLSTGGVLEPHCHVIVSLQRVNAGTTGTNHAGSLQILGATIYQTI